MAQDNDPAEMSLEEFIQLPTTVDFYAIDTQRFRSYIADKPYIKVGDILSKNIIIAYAPEDKIEQIYKERGNEFLGFFPQILGLLDKEANDNAGITRIQNQPYLNLTGRGTVIGFVDTGIDYTKPEFQYEDGSSKIKYIWDQTLEGPRPGDIHFGAVYTREDINKALKNENPYDIVPHRDTVGHGTFLASVAAGRKTAESIGAAPDAEIIAVKLRKARPYYLNKYLVPEDQENAYGATDILLGLKYILTRAAETLSPVVICFALGTNFGGHDASSLIEKYIDHLSDVAGIMFCTAVGNEGNEKHHVEGHLRKKGDKQTIGVTVGESGKSFYLSIWYAAWDQITVSVKSPLGEIMEKVPLELGIPKTRPLKLEKSVITVTYNVSESRFCFIQIKDPTPGLWEITLYADTVITGTYHAWLPITGFVSRDIAFATPTPYYTAVIPSTSLNSVVSGAYNPRDDSLYMFNSWGPTRSPRIAPDVVAPGVNIQGVFPTGYGTMSGSSVATAVTAGASALIFEWGLIEGKEPGMTGNRVRTLLISGCERDADKEYPNVQWGYGRLNLSNTFDSLKLSVSE